MTKRKAAVIGVFNIGKNHVKAWANTEGAQLVAIADLNAKLCEEVKAEFQIGESYLVRMYPGPATIVNREGKNVLEAPPVLNANLGVTHDFLQAVQSGQRPCVDGEQGIQLHKMLDAIVQSANEGREIPIN
jgi:predicted dehydrogenase